MLPGLEADVATDRLTKSNPLRSKLLKDPLQKDCY